MLFRSGLEKGIETIQHFRKKSSAPLIANIVAGQKQDFGVIAEEIDTLKPDLIEVNISCPNVEDELGKPFACDRSSAEEITKLVKSKTTCPVVVKLSPNVENIISIAQAVEGAGADGITAINTVGPGMRFNIDLRTSLLANKVGGVSGPAIFPLAVKAVYDIYSSVKIPIIATGGVNSGRDALEIMMAGGTLVGVGTAIYYHGDEFWKKATEEMSEWLDKEGIKNISEVIGLFHRN